MKTISLYSIVCLSLTAYCGTAYAVAATNLSAAATAVAPALTPLNAQFETIECELSCKKPRVSTWSMWRTHTQVELRKTGAYNSELWTWENGHANYQFLMHDEKKVIEYATIDLKMLDIATDSSKWQKVTSLVSQKDLVTLKNARLKKHYKGLALTQYSGKIEGIETNIVWIPSLQIPLQMTYFYPKQKITINLVDSNLKMTTASPTSEQTINGYQRIDYTDIGDMEHSEQARKWLSKVKDAPGINAKHL